MNIEEEQIENLNNEPPKFKPNLYPIPYKKGVQAPYHISVFLGCRGSGKSYGICKMVKNAEDSGFYDPITNEKIGVLSYLFSPTVNSNPIFTSLKSLDEDRIINEYTDEQLIQIIEYIKAQREKIKEYRNYVEAYKKYEKMSDQQIKKSTDYEMFALLYNHNFIHYKELEKVEQYVYFIILDDCISDKKAFSNKKDNALTKAILNSRHIGINIIIASQNLRGSVPKIIRNNTDVWVLFRCKNQKVLIDDIYPELSSQYTLNEWLAYYNYATSASDHDALVYDGKEKNKEDRMKLNFDVILRLK